METKTCDHYMVTGLKCDSPAIRDTNYCRHHIRYYDSNDVPAGNPDYAPAVPDHPDASLLSVHQATRALLAGKISEKTCRLLIYSAQVNSQIMGQRLAHQRHVEQLDRDYMKQLAAEDRADACAKALIEAIGKLDDSPETLKQIEAHLKNLPARN